MSRTLAKVTRVESAVDSRLARSITRLLSPFAQRLLLVNRYVNVFSFDLIVYLDMMCEELWRVLEGFATLFPHRRPTPNLSGGDGEPFSNMKDDGGR